MSKLKRQVRYHLEQKQSLLLRQMAKLRVRVKVKLMSHYRTSRWWRSRSNHLKLLSWMRLCSTSRWKKRMMTLSRF